MFSELREPEPKKSQESIFSEQEIDDWLLSDEIQSQSHMAPGSGGQ